MGHRMKTSFFPFALLALVAGMGLSAGCVSSGSQDRSAAARVPAGYLSKEALPDSVALIPPPPDAGSPALAWDEEMMRKSLFLRDTPQWMLAIEDADLTFPHSAGTFSCALDAPVTNIETPHLYTLLRRTMSDASNVTSAAKTHYNRRRPFVENGEPICSPDEQQLLVKSGSYPSGHAAIGWALALILAEIDPAHGDAILERGLAFGQNRVVCNVHWESDVREGRILGAAVVARLHADNAFRADLEAAKAELAAVRAKGLKPRRNCTAEAQAMVK